MGCLKIGGKVVGGTDGPSQSWPACYRGQGTRNRLGCDAMPINAAVQRKMGRDDDRLMEFRDMLKSLGLSEDEIAKACAIADRKSGMVADDDRADTIRSMCMGKLSEAEIAELIKVAIGEIGPAADPGYAADSHVQPRAAQRRAYEERFPDSMRLGADHYGTSVAPVRGRAPTDAGARSFHERFPDAGRLGHA